MEAETTGEISVRSSLSQIFMPAAQNTLASLGCNAAAPEFI